MPLSAIYLAINGKQCGPYALEELNRMLLLREITLETLAWQAGMSQWAPIAGFAGIERPPESHAIHPGSGSKPAVATAATADLAREQSGYRANTHMAEKRRLELDAPEISAFEVHSEPPPAPIKVDPQSVAKQFAGIHQRVELESAPWVPDQASGSQRSLFAENNEYVLYQEVSASDAIFHQLKDYSYTIRTPDRRILAYVEEPDQGVLYKLVRFWARIFMGFQFEVLSDSRKPWFTVKLERGWSFPPMTIYSPTGAIVGVVRREWGWVRAKYALEDEKGGVFCRVQSALFRMRFAASVLSILDMKGAERGEIRLSLQWTPWQRMTDQSNVEVDLTGDWTFEQRIVILMAALRMNYYR